MGMGVKVDLTRMRARQAAIAAAARAELDGTTRAAMQMFVKEASGFTPPASKHDGSIQQAVKALKERIARDLAGDGDEKDGEMCWITVHGQPKLVFKDKYRQDRQPSPFVAVRRIDDKAKAAHNVGKYGVEVAEDPAAYMASKPGRYYVRRRSGKGAAHLRWSGARAITTAAALKKAVRERQRRAGTLMSGWNALANEVHARLPASIKRLPGRGSCARVKDNEDRLRLSGRNSADVHRVGLDGILARRKKQIDNIIKKKLATRANILRRKLKSIR